MTYSALEAGYFSPKKLQVRRWMMGDVVEGFPVLLLHANGAYQMHETSGPVDELEQIKPDPNAFKPLVLYKSLWAYARFCPHFPLATMHTV